MTNEDTKKTIFESVEQILEVEVTDISTPKQGMDSEVIFITTKFGNKLVIKYSSNAINDVIALNLIHKNNLSIPVPKLVTHFVLEDKFVVVLERIEAKLLEEVPTFVQHKYIASMLQNLQEIHTIKSSWAGLLNAHDKSKNWKELLLFKYSGKHPWFNWDEIKQRDGVNAQLVETAMVQLIDLIKDTQFMEDEYALLHTDFNQRNLFVDDKKLVGIIDWGESMYGDPLYDFARVRMYIWHHNLNPSALEIYYRTLNMSKEEKKREEIYLVSQILDYITWYSEEKNEFNNGRLKLHQKFLADWLKMLIDKIY